jgi:3-oxoadipate CoA-transferase alpha subunit
VPELAATPGQTIGPFFHYALPYPGDRELVPRGSAGSVRLHGYVYDGEGNDVPDALLEIRQADPAGTVPTVPGSQRRDGAPFTGWGRSSTDASGHYWFSSVEPGPARPEGAPFFAVVIFARGLLNRLFTRIYLPAGHAVLGADPLLSTLDAEALLEGGASELTVVSNNAGNGEVGLAALIREGRVRKIVCSFPRQSDSWHFDQAWRAGAIELELVPQGNLAERIRAAGAGIGAFFTPTGFGTPLADGKETRVIDGRGYLLEYPLRGDVALIAAHKADELGNLVYRKTARNFGPIMAAAATTTVAQVDEIVPVGALDPEHVVTPCLYVDRVVCVDRNLARSGDTL